MVDLSGSVPISEIPNYIQEKNNERQKLEEDIKKLTGEQLEAKVALAMALDENKVSLAELEQFSPLKVELDKLGISVVEDIPRAISIIHGVRKSGYSIDTIRQLLSAWEASSDILAHLDKNIKAQTDKARNLQGECERLEELLEELASAHRLKESLFKELEAMGFGLKELKILFYTIKEATAENKMPENQAVQKFLEDIQKNYDDKLGYESTLERLKSEIEKVNSELNKQRSELRFNQETAQVIRGLLATGVSVQQILDFALFVHNNIDSLKYDSSKKTLEISKVRTSL
jgi:chromosome segregation ATPase